MIFIYCMLSYVQPPHVSCHWHVCSLSLSYSHTFKLHKQHGVEFEDVVFEPDNGLFEFDNMVVEFDNGVFEHCNGLFESDSKVVEFDNGVYEPDNGLFESDNRVVECDNGIFA